MYKLNSSEIKGHMITGEEKRARVSAEFYIYGQQSVYIFSSFSVKKKSANVKISHQDCNPCARKSLGIIISFI